MPIVYDFLYALRLLKKTPKFTALTIMVLCGGLAIALFTYGFLHTLTSKPLPLPEQGTLYRGALYWQGETFGMKRYLPAYEAAKIRKNTTAFAEHGIWQNKTISLSRGDNKQITAAVRTSSNLFKVSRTEPILGRTLEPFDSEEGQPAVGMISYGIWQSQFGGEKDIIGKTMYVNGVTTEVVGVMPKGYRFPISHDVWLPIEARLLNPLKTDVRNVHFYGRLKDGVTPEEAQSQFFNLAKNAFADRAQLHTGIELISADVGLFQQFDISQSIKILVAVLNLIALFILFLAAINVGNLLFARAIQRNKESAVRSALGAPLWRLVSQLMWEGVIITTVGTVVALALVGWLLSMINVYFHSLMGNELAFWYQWGMDSSVLLAGIGFALFTILIACFLPAMKAAKQDFNSVLRDGTRGAQGRNVGRMSRFLVTMQICIISIIMIIGAVISVKVNQVTDLQLGYSFEKMYFAIVDLPESRYKDKAEQVVFFDKFQKQLAQRNEVSDVAIRFDLKNQQIAIDGVQYLKTEDKPRLQVFGLIGGTEFMGPYLREGRFLDARDNDSGANTVLISESMAQRNWPNSTALGKRLEMKLDEQSSWFTIVGVVSNISNNAFTKPAVEDEIYVSGYQYLNQSGTVFFRRTVSGGAAEDSFFRAMNGMDSQMDILTIENWELEVDGTQQMTTTFRDTIMMSGLFALLLAVTGIYGLTVFSVEKRSQEVGIRRALGAKDNAILRMFVSQSAKQLIIGLIVGSVLSGLLLMVAASVLTMPAYVYASIYIGVLGTLCAVVIAAVVIPSRKAIKMQPADALRYE
jgi:predicted permease